MASKIRMARMSQPTGTPSIINPASPSQLKLGHAWPTGTLSWQITSNYRNHKNSQTLWIEIINRPDQTKTPTSIGRIKPPKLETKSRKMEDLYLQTTGNLEWSKFKIRTMKLLALISWKDWLLELFLKIAEPSRINLTAINWLLSTMSQMPSNSQSTRIASSWSHWCQIRWLL